MKLLLDTCTFLWIAGGVRPIPSRVAAAYRSPDHEVFLSAASAWEIAVKHAAGRLALPAPPQSLIPAERERLGVAPLPIDEESSLHVARLPLLHRDPFDRMLVAQAIVHGMTIATPDDFIARYAARTMWRAEAPVSYSGRRAASRVLFIEQEPGPRGSPHRPHAPADGMSNDLSPPPDTANTDSSFCRSSLLHVGHAGV